MLINPVLLRMLAQASETGDKERVNALCELICDQIDSDDKSILFLNDFTEPQQKFILSFREDLDHDFVIPAFTSFESIESCHPATIKSLVKKGIIDYERGRWRIFIGFQKTIILEDVTPED